LIPLADLTSFSRKTGVAHLRQKQALIYSAFDFMRKPFQMAGLLLVFLFVAFKATDS
jgi:hypothetical protein